MNQIKIGFFSDTHLRTDLVFPDEVDCFIHCGDLLNSGTIEELKEAADFFKHRLAGRPMYFTPGNHDNALETTRIKSLEILKDAGIEVYIDQKAVIRLSGHVIRAYFMPWVPRTTNAHVFNVGDQQRKELVERIPEDIDLLITHGPADSILDSNEYGEHYGCQFLLEKIAKMKSRLKIHAFGHVHESGGILMNDDFPLFINASVGERVNSPPIVIEYPSLKILEGTIRLF